MITQVRKRDGRVVDFSRANIESAIRKAARATNTNLDVITVSNYVIKTIEDKFNDQVPSVEQIQDAVENTLVHFDYSDTAKAYILYRQKRSNEREGKYLIDVISLIDDYIEKKDWRVKENANASYSVSGLTFHIAGSVIANYSLNKYPHHIGHAHKNGDIHIHDLSLGLVCGYCAGWDLEKLFLEGINGIPGKIDSNPANHLTSATWQMINFIGTLQNEWAGAQAFNGVDTLLAPFIRKDKLAYKQVKQAMQGLVFNLNVPSRWSCQSPFSNFTFDWTIPEDRMEDIPVIGGKPMDFVYGDLQEESLMINKAFMEVMTEGDAKGRTFTFPIPTINITKEFDWNGPLTDELFALTAKYGPYYFANFVKSDLNPKDIRSMCPLSGNEKILTKSTRGRNVEYSTIKNVYKSPKEEYEIFSDGRFVKGRFNEYKNQRMIKVSLENGHTIKISENHLNFVMKDKESSEEVVKGKDLIIGMYMPYSLNVFEGYGGTHEMGYFVGAFAGDGSIGDNKSSVIFSLSIGEKETVCKKLKEIAEKHFGANCIVIDYDDTKLLTLRINSRTAVGLCEDFIEGMNIYKCYKARTFGMSIEFRKGVVEGHLDTDGGNRNRIYTSSLKMIETLNMLCATLGTTTSIFKDDRDNRYSQTPNYAVLIYKLNRKQYGDMWFKDNNRLWMKIKSIVKCKSETAYCFEVADGTPIFTVGTTGILTHNCRLSLNLNELRNKMGGLFGAGSQTGSIAVTTINLPRLGYLSKTDNEFFERLDVLLDIAKESMEIKRKVVSRHLELGLMPYTKRYLGHLNGHFSTIGIIGMNECLVNYMDKGIWDRESYNFGIGIMDHIRSKLIEIQKETGNLYNLEATPAEGTTRRLAAIDKKHYPDIIVANEQKWKENRASPFYTNSIHLPVGYTNDLFESLDLEEEFLTKFTGGCVKHIYLGERLPSAESARNLVKKVCSNYKVPYISITPSFSVCPQHGYINGVHDTCPKEV